MLMGALKPEGLKTASQSSLICTDRECTENSHPDEVVLPLVLSGQIFVLYFIERVYLIMQ